MKNYQEYMRSKEIRSEEIIKYYCEIFSAKKQSSVTELYELEYPERRKAKR